VAVYRQIFRAFAGKPVVVRVVDAGSDRPLAYLADNPGGLASRGKKKRLHRAWNGAFEGNPALGLRGLRALMRHADVLERQLKAIAAAAAGTGAEVHALAPMVSTPAEAAWFADRCREAGIGSAGAMLEVPAAALTSKHVAERVDFISVGTNDLTSYAMAADRDLGALAELTDHWQPAVLALIAAACAGALGAGRPASICGEAASDPLLAPVLVGLGATSLSMAPAYLGEVADAIGARTLDQCKRLAADVLAVGSRDEARALAAAEILG
jgi:phosphotransferase system enzyme I (PtsI)